MKKIINESHVQVLFFDVSVGVKYISVQLNVMTGNKIKLIMQEFLKSSSPRPTARVLSATPSRFLMNE